MKDNEK